MPVIEGRMTAAHDGPVVVFIIGMRVNRLFAIRRWLPVFRAMGAMLKDLSGDAASGFLGAEFAFKSWRAPVLIQYWRSFEQLHAYAHDPARDHRPAWRAFNQAAGGDGSVGIYHETYIVAPGGYETVYANMPPIGLGAVGGVMPATGKRNAAKDRLRAGAAPEAQRPSP